MALVRHVRRGQPITADSYNQLVDAVNAVVNLSARPPIKLFRGPGSMAIGLDGDMVLRYVELSEDVHDDSGQDPADKNDRKGWDIGLSGSEFKSSEDDPNLSVTDRERIANVVNEGIWLKEEWLPVYDEPTTGRLLPLVGPGPHLCKATTEITGPTDATPGTGNANVYSRDTDSGDVVDSTHSIDVLNLGGAVKLDEYFWSTWHRQSRAWWVQSAGGGGGARFYDFTLTEDLILLADGVGDLDIAWGGEMPTSPTGVVLKNGMGKKFEGPSGTQGICSTTKVQGEYLIIQLECDTQPNP